MKLENKKAIITGGASGMGKATAELFSREGASIAILDINKEEEIDTTGGLVFYIANKVPKINEVFVYDNKIQFKILKANERRIIAMEIKKII